jgi:hypothetical protein
VIAWLIAPAERDLIQKACNLQAALYKSK